MCYFILSDIHANATALAAVMKTTQHVLTTKKYYYLGDLLGYGPAVHAIDCVRWLHFESNIYADNGPTEVRWIPGNHDEWAVKHGTARDEGVVTLLAQIEDLKTVNPTDWDWFAAEVQAAIAGRSWLTITRAPGPDGLTLAFTHGGTFPPHRETYLYPWQPLILQDHFAPVRRLSDAGTKILFCGHSHFPFLAELLPDERHTIIFHSICYGQPIHLPPGEYIINPGSVGHPRDADPRAAFVMFEPDARTVEFRRVEYDTQPVVDALRREQGNEHRPQHEKAARHLLRQDVDTFKGKLAAKEQPSQDKPGQSELWKQLERGREINVEKPPERLLDAYVERVEKAYDRLIHEIETGYGGLEEQEYHYRVYRAPKWDLESLQPPPATDK